MEEEEKRDWVSGSVNANDSGSGRGLTRKVYVHPDAPSETDTRSDEQRVMDAAGQPFRLTLPALRSLSECFAQEKYDLTLSLALADEDRLVCVRVEPGDTRQTHYGYGIDLGSTGVVVSLIDVAKGQICSTVNVPNRQIRYGEDILTRIFYSKDDVGKREELRQAALASIEEAFARLQEETGIAPEQCISAVAAGNTCMMHFLLGLDAFCLFSAPYVPHADRGGFYPAKELGLPLPGYVYLYPCFANYIGGDTFSGIISTDLYRRDELSVFFDVGTNGELVVGCRDFLLCGAGAAGPALEGGSVITGMRADTGAVQGVRMQITEGETRTAGFVLDVIGETAPCGICGSGIVDLLSELFIHGYLSMTGKFCPEVSGQIKQRTLPGTEQQQPAVEYAPGLWFYQQDVDEFLRTKAAAWTMMDYMLTQAGITAGDIHRFYMCGAFGTHMQIESAVNIGMYPDVSREKIIPAGNTSLDGCVKLLLDAGYLQDIREIRSLMTYIQFGDVENFLERMHAALALPHTDIELFPSVKKRMTEE